jgi:hypothetical protein
MSRSVPVPFLAQEVFELAHQLLRVTVVLTAWVRRLVLRCVRVLLSLPHRGLDSHVLRHRLVTLGPKGPYGRLKRGESELQVE